MMRNAFNCEVSQARAAQQPEGSHRRIIAPQANGQAGDVRKQVQTKTDSFVVRAVDGRILVVKPK